MADEGREAMATTNARRQSRRNFRDIKWETSIGRLVDYLRNQNLTAGVPVGPPFREFRSLVRVLHDLAASKAATVESRLPGSFRNVPLRSEGNILFLFPHPVGSQVRSNRKYSRNNR